MTVHRHARTMTPERLSRGRGAVFVCRRLGLLGMLAAGLVSGCRTGGEVSTPFMAGSSTTVSLPMAPPAEPLPPGLHSAAAPDVRPESIPPVVESKPTITPEQVSALQQSLDALRQQQSEVLQSLSHLQAADGQRDARLASLESHIAAQAMALVDLRKTIGDQQREQWRTLDVLSDGLDEILRDEPTATLNGVARSRRREASESSAAGEQERQ